MYIQRVSLWGFRNLVPVDLELNQGMNLFYGSNAQGKTNFLEALYFCATGRSQRTKNDKELIAFGEKQSHIRMVLQKNNRSERIDVHLKQEEKKGIAVNGVAIRRLGDLYGTAHMVIFSPEDLNLIKEGPGERRRFLDMELCQLSRVYYNNLQQYYHILKQRNHLLKEIQKNPSLEETLFAWDGQMVAYGNRLISARRDFLIRLNKISSQKQKEVTGGLDELKIIYKPYCTESDFSTRLQKSAQRDIFTGSTQTGPHKDDILFFVNGNEVKTFGSQGQQKTTALCMKLAEIELIEMETGQKPILLLDDVLSELDASRQDYLMEHIQKIQTVLTCTGVEDIVKKHFLSGSVFSVQEGKIEKQ